MNDVPEWVPEQAVFVWEQLRAYPILGSALIIIVSFAVGRVLASFVVRALERVAKRTRTELDDKILPALRRPLFLTVLFLGLVAAADVAGLPPRLERAVIGTDRREGAAQQMQRDLPEEENVEEETDEARLDQRQEVPALRLVGQRLVVWNPDRLRQIRDALPEGARPDAPEERR